VGESEKIQDPFCDALPGMSPHNFVSVVDVLGGTGIWLYCTQCGDYAYVDGSKPSHHPLNQQQQQPTPANAASPTPTNPLASLP